MRWDGSGKKDIRSATLETKEELKGIASNRVFWVSKFLRGQLPFLYSTLLCWLRFGIWDLQSG